MTDFNSLKKQYEALSAICDVAADKEETLREFRSRMSIFVLRVWSAQPGFHEDYIPALALMAEGQEMSKDTILDFMKQASQKPEIPMVPAFAMLTVAAGETEDTSVCRTFVEGLVQFLTDMAFINGDCTPEEANEIEKIRMAHLDFYNEYMLTKRRVKSGAIPAGDFKYERYGATVEYTLREDGSAVFDSDGEGGSQEAEKASGPDPKYIAKSRYLDDIIQVERKAAEKVGVTDFDFHAWWYDGTLLILGKIYAAKGLRKEFSLSATLYDQDGDIAEQDENREYGGGSIICSTVREDNFFQGYPVQFTFLNPVEKKEDISKIKITFCH